MRPPTYLEVERRSRVVLVDLHGHLRHLPQQLTRAEH